MGKELAKAYEPHEVEERIYEFWMNGKYFHAEVDSKKKPYTIVIPPPNITGQLHMGHALDETLQDILIRFRRMQGYSALWLPGTDHASIATEAKIVEAMKQEGVTKEDIGRDGFMKRAWEWKEKYGGTIISQLKKLGSSCDWDRERFTLDEGCSKAVKEVFVKLYNEGLIYRGERMINWCPNCKTSISDAEVDFAEKDGNFWHIRYPLADGSGYLNLATTRPETMLGDTAVAVHPEDERYQHLIGKMLILPLVGREIPIVADTYVEQDFGTGVVKITPAHDPNDFEVGLRHNLPVINIMDESGIINENGGEYQGMDRLDARKKIVKALEEQGYLIKVEPIKHNVGTCYRCKTVVEPRVSKQWFVKMEPLAKPAVKAVEDGEVKFVPERFDKIYFNWMNNIKDWCISRQLWWGHRIPAWYCDDCNEITVSRETPHACCKCGSTHIHQDEDTLDTWFSSALWPFSTLGWPDNTEELNYFYPTNTLVTGYDIIFFWVARMIFSGLAHIGKVPFDTVFIHGIVRDANGVKMSKSLGNGIDPLEVIDQYGADALRFMLATGNSPGNDMRYSPEKVEASRNFANKIWNAARFILMNLEGHEIKNELPNELTTEDKWIISSFNRVAKEITDNLEKFELGIAAQKIYDFLWDVFCDWYIEIAKIRMNSDDAQTAQNAREVLVWVMTGTLKLLHPFMPFITEEIWQHIPHEGKSIMVADWSTGEETKLDDASEVEMTTIMETIKAIRNMRAEVNAAPSKKTEVILHLSDESLTDVFAKNSGYLETLASAKNVTILAKDDAKPENAMTAVVNGVEIYLPLAGLIDVEKETARLNKELATLDKEVSRLDKKLSNAGFIAKAPADIVEKEKEKLKDYEEKREAVKQRLAYLATL